jgi:hypothetical protein
MHNENKNQTDYHAYLLRFWRAAEPPENGLHSWRFSLEDPHTSARRGFQDLNSLLLFLEAQIEAGEKKRNNDDSSID